VCLVKEGNVVCLEDVVEEIVVDQHQYFLVFQILSAVPNVNKLLLHKFEFWFLDHHLNHVNCEGLLLFWHRSREFYQVRLNIFSQLICCHLHPTLSGSHSICIEPAAKPFLFYATQEKVFRLLFQLFCKFRAASFIYIKQFSFDETICKIFNIYFAITVLIQNCHSMLR